MDLVTIFCVKLFVNQIAQATSSAPMMKWAVAMANVHTGDCLEKNDVPEDIDDVELSAWTSEITRVWSGRCDRLLWCFCKPTGMLRDLEKASRSDSSIPGYATDP